MRIDSYLSVVLCIFTQRTQTGIISLKKYYVRVNNLGTAIQQLFLNSENSLHIATFELIKRAATNTVLKPTLLNRDSNQRKKDN